MASSTMQRDRRFGAKLFGIRARQLRMTQKRFAEQFGLSVGAVQDLEQGRSQPPRAVEVLIATIALQPDLVRQAASNVQADIDRRAAQRHAGVRTVRNF